MAHALDEDRFVLMNRSFIITADGPRADSHAAIVSRVRKALSDPAVP
jgi:hypothetical protein